MDATLDAARTLVAACRDLVDGAVARLAGAATVDGRVDVERLDREQVLAYDLASAASRVAAAEELLAYGERGGLEERLAVVFAGETAADLVARTAGREQDWGISGGFALAEARDALSAARSVALLDEVAAAVLENPDLPRHLPEELALARQTFKDFAEAEVRPVAERVHREDADIPDEVIAELGGMGCFGLSIPERHGGFAQGESADDFLSMVVVTEELSRGSLGVAGSLITRPEILSKALVKGGRPSSRSAGSRGSRRVS